MHTESMHTWKIWKWKHYSQSLINVFVVYLIFRLRTLVLLLYQSVSIDNVNIRVFQDTAGQRRRRVTLPLNTCTPAFVPVAPLCLPALPLFLHVITSHHPVRAACLVPSASLCMSVLMPGLPALNTEHRAGRFLGFGWTSGGGRVECGFKARSTIPLPLSTSKLFSKNEERDMAWRIEHFC